MKDSDFIKDQTIKFCDSHGVLHEGNVADYLLNFAPEYMKMANKKHKKSPTYGHRQHLVTNWGLEPPKIKPEDMQHRGKRFIKDIKDYRFWTLYRFNTKGNDCGLTL